MDQNTGSQKPSKRIKNPKSHKRTLNKTKRENGQEYENYKGKIIAAKIFKKVVCKCRKSCHLTIPEIEQQTIFDEYWNLSTWTQKTSFLLNNISSTDCKKRRRPDRRRNIQFKKSFHRDYFFGSEKKIVCKKFFKSVLQISETRIEKCMKKKQVMSSDCTTDLRGKHKMHRKTPADRIRGVISFINSLPNYESHYAREPNSNRKYLASNLNLKIIYDEYKAVCDEKNDKPLSNYMFRDIFYRKFNLRFKPPLQDTCNFCDIMKHQINAAPIKSIQRMQLIEQRETHWEGVRLLEREQREYVSESRLTPGEKIVLVFDLEKVFETPKLASSRAFYSRQLSTYNLCVHDETHNRTYMYLWHEAIASKGPQEITSCLLYHFNNFIPNECKEIILYSDSCGAQNRNIKTSAMLSHVLEKSSHLQSITQHFLRSGHSYNVCDRKFAIIEKKRKKVDNIYVPSQWKTLIENAKQTLPQFKVIEMNATNFLSCESLLAQFCTNRKKTVDNKDLNWFTFRKIGYRKGYPMKLFLETYDDVALKYDESVEFHTDQTKILSVAKKGLKLDEFTKLELPLLHPQGRPIPTPKKVDLMELINLIPLEFRGFYTDLNHTEKDREEVEKPIEEIIEVSDGE